MLVDRGLGDARRPRDVVAVLGVVVVLDRDRIPIAEPGEQGGSSFPREHDAGRVLVGGRQHHRIDVRLLEPVDPRPGLVDPDRNRPEAGARGDATGSPASSV